MNISIKTTNIELTPALRDYTEKRISGLNKFSNEEITAAVEIGKTSNHHKNSEDLYRAEVNINTSLGKQFRAVSEKSDLYEAIDDVREQMSRELSSAKGKKDALWKKGARKIKSIMRGFRN